MPALLIYESMRRLKDAVADAAPPRHAMQPPPFFMRRYAAAMACQRWR